MLVIRAGIQKTVVRIANKADSGQIASSGSVLDLFGRQKCLIFWNIYRILDSDWVIILSYSSYLIHPSCKNIMKSRLVGGI